MISKDRILAVCFLVVASVSTVVCSDNELLETLMAGIQVKEKLLPGEKPSNESESLIFSLSNRGMLENSLGNLNLMHSLELKDAFKRVRDATADRVKCKTFTSPSIVVFKLCAVNNTKREVTGSYSSNIKITKAVRYDNNVRVINYVLSVLMSASVSEASGKYERCSIKDPSWLQKQYTKHQNLDTSHHYKGKDKKKVYEFMMPSVQYITVAMLREPYFFRIVLTEPPKTNDTIGVCHGLVEHSKQKAFNVKPENCSSFGSEKRKIMKNIDKSVMLKFEEDGETFSILLYDSSIQERELENAHQRKGIDPRYLQLFGFSKHNIPKKVSYENASNGKMFTFTFDTTNDDISAHQLVIFIQHNTTNNDAHLDDVDKKQVEKPKPSEQVRQDILNWIMTGNTSFDHLHCSQKGEYTKLPAVCPKKQLTCGIVAMEMVRQKNVKNSLIEIPLLTMFLTTKVKMNQNGKALGKNELKLLQRELSVTKDKAQHSEVLLEMNPEFMSRVKRMVLYVKRSITSKFGAKVWKSFVFSSELMITRRLKCNNKVCDGTIRAMFQYNVTRKPQQKRRPVIAPKGIHIRLAFTFNRPQQRRQQKPQLQQQLPQLKQPQQKQQQQKQEQPLPPQLKRPQQQQQQQPQEQQRLPQLKRPQQKLLQQQQQQQQQRLHRQQQHQQKQLKLSSRKKDDFTSKLFFKPAASKDRDAKLKKIDVFSKGQGINPRHFKINEKHLSNKDSQVAGVAQVIADGLKKYGDDLERFTKEQMKIMKERASKSSGWKFRVNLFMCTVGVVVNGWLLLSQ